VSNKPVRSLILCLWLAGGFALFGLDNDPGGQLVNVGDHRLFVHCAGSPSEMTVVLENGLGAGLEIWKTVQSSVEASSVHRALKRTTSGHVMAVEQPEIVVESIRDVIRQAKTLKSGALRK
jgi:hypothetical protein